MEPIQKWLSFVVIGAWVLSTLVIVVVIVAGRVDIETGLKLLSQVSGVTSGFVGVIIGYYFTRSK